MIVRCRLFRPDQQRHRRRQARFNLVAAPASEHVNRRSMLVLPGGVANPDTLRMHPVAVKIVKAFISRNAPVAAICHGPWLLAEADVLRGRKLTSWPSVRTDLRNAGAEVVDEQVVVDGNLINSRRPDDIPAFNKAIIDALQALAQASP